jgi:hypothetical protein
VTRAIPASVPRHPRVHRGDRPRLAVGEQEGDAVGGPDGRSHPHAGGQDRDPSVGFAAAAVLDERRPVNLTEHGRRSATQARGAEERLPPRDGLGRRVGGGPQIEVGAPGGDTRGKRVGDSSEALERLAPDDAHARDVLQPEAVARHPAYLLPSRLLIVPLISAASRARGSRST